MKRIIIFTITCILLGLLPVQARQMSFQRISTDEGLSHGTVLSIVQDSQGKLWFATHDGLNCYDGYSFNVYRHSNDTPNSIANNYIRLLKADSKGRLWISDGNSLSVYNPTSDSFLNYTRGDSESILAIEELSQNKLLIATSHLLGTFDTESGQFDDSTLPGSMRDVSIRSFAREGDFIYMGSASGDLYCWNLSANDIRRFFLGSKRCPVRCIYPDGETIWAGTDGEGLFKVDRTSAETLNFSVRKDGLISDHIRSLTPDSEGRLWVGTYEGLNIYDGRSFVSCTWSASDNRTLSNNSIRCIYRDHQGGMWIGTYYGGINYYHPLRNEFMLIVPQPADVKFVDNRITGIVQDSPETVLLANGYAGVMRYNLATGMTSYLHIPGANSGTYDIKALYVDNARDRIWLGGNFGGLNVIDRKTGRITHCQGLPSQVYSLVQKDDSHLFVCTSTQLHILDLSNGITSVETALKDERRIQTIYKDSKERIWTGGYHGVRVYENDLDYKPLDFPQLNTITRVSSIMESCSSGDMYIGTDCGLYRFSGNGSGSLFYYSTDDGLPNNVICSINEDAFGLIWIGTENGLCRYNPFNGTFRAYGQRDGLRCSRFIANAGCLLSDGTLFLGASDGLVSFVPESIKDDPFSPSPVIWKICASGEYVSPENSPVILRGDNTPLQFTFSTMNYLSGGRDRFRYRLDGYEKRWHTVIGHNSATYMRLSPGKYTFELQSANDEGVWNSTPATVLVKVSRIRTGYPSLWLYILLLLITGTAILVIYKRQVRKTADDTASRSETPGEEFIRKASEVVEANLSNESFTIVELAKYLGMSRSVMYERMKEYAGITAFEFIRKKRFERACALLEKGRATVSEISYEVGFSSPDYFSKAFRKYYGMSPKEYCKNKKTE